MKKFFMRAAMASSFLATQAMATSIIISSASVDLNYDATTNRICDGSVVGNCAGGNGNSANADVVAAMTFTVGGGGPVWVLTNNIFVDFNILLNGPLTIPTLPATQSSTTISGGYFDLLTNAGASGYGLAMTISSGSVTVTTAGANFTLNGTGVATGAGSGTPTNTLPIEGPFTISFSSQSLQFAPAQGASGNLGSFTANGSADVSGSYVPEPGTYALLGSALLGLGILRRRKA
jgi:hypothetical protein